MVGTHLQFRPSFRPVARVARWLHHNLPPLNFITLHYAYFIGTCLISAIIFWGSSTPFRSVSFTDSLFLTISAMTLAGLNTVNLSTLNTFQQFMLFVLIMLGSAIFVSSFVVHVRKKAFERKFKILIARDRARRTSSRGRSSRRMSVVQLDQQSQNRTSRAASPMGHDEPTAGASRPPVDDVSSPVQANGSEKDAPLEPPQTPVRRPTTDREDHVTFSPSPIFRLTSPEEPPREAHNHHRFIRMTGVGAHANANLHRRSISRSSAITGAETFSSTLGRRSTQKYFPSSGFISRNSQFHHLTEAERERLGGVEYKALSFLSVLVPLYFFLFQFFGCIGLGAYVANNRPNTARENGLNPWWVGSFNAVSAFNNSGMSLLDANMVAFQTSIYMLITMGLLILAGNTCFPIFLRLIVWTIMKLMPDNERWEDRRRTLRFLLDHPRRCYTNLFPSEHTWWLLLSVIGLNGVDWVAFEILNIGNKAITILPEGIYIIDGLFQALAVRSGGFYVVPISTVRISLQVLYVVMMYISVYPVVITMRNSNVYEERSLGIYADDPAPSDDPFIDSSSAPQKKGLFPRLRRSFVGRSGEQTKSYFVRQQLRAQLAHDAWWIVLAVFLIMIVEGGQFERNPVVFSVFNVIFEVVSGYGCVGISVGVPNEAYSFCGAWHTLSKLILCAVMIRGRHRGLPVAIDKAVLLPGEGLGHAEEEDAQIRLERTMSRSGAAPV